MPTPVLDDPLTQAIAAVRDGLRAAPEPPIATFVAGTQPRDGYRVEVAIRDFAFVADEPARIGGTDAGPTPVELVLAGLGTCREIVCATYARGLGVPLDAVAVRAEGSLDLRGFSGVADVPAGFAGVADRDAVESPAPAAEVARLVETVNAHCPVLEILRRPVPVTGSHTLNGEPLAAL